MATFYIASAFDNRHKVAAIIKLLREMGHSITHDWTVQEVAYTHHAAKHAQEDMDGVVACTDFVALFDEPLHPLNTYVELGMALGLGKRIYVIGNFDKDCIFSKLPGIQRFNALVDFLQVANGRLK